MHLPFLSIKSKGVLTIPSLLEVKIAWIFNRKQNEFKHTEAQVNADTQQSINKEVNANATMN